MVNQWKVRQNTLVIGSNQLFISGHERSSIPKVSSQKNKLQIEVDEVGVI